MSESRTIKVNYLARVEGEGALTVHITDGKVEDVQLRIFEPPRFFEAFLRGRKFTEVPDITARICGICPVAYQMSSIHAMEDICGVSVTGPVRELRRLIYCGEWIESHALHVFMLHLPDFLGYADAIKMAKDHGEAVKRGLRIKKAGNSIVTLIGGREIHPINVRVGGFFRVPSKRELRPLRDELKSGRDETLTSLKLISSLDFPDLELDYEFGALRHPEEYPFNEGRIVTNKGVDIAVRNYDDVFREDHVPYSNALQTTVIGRNSCFLGPMARLHLNFDRLPENVKAAARSAGITSECRNPFKSIIIRMIETLYAFEEALRIIDAYEEPDFPAVKCEPRAGTGYGCTEAPRGLLYHRYTTDDAGIIQDAKIVAPTSVNQKTIENDLRHFVGANLHLGQEELTWKCEQAIRNYDPCISCATHFLTLKIDQQ